MADLAIVTVTFHPELALLQRQIAAIPREAFIVVVDNVSGPEVVEALREAARHRGRMTLIENIRNLGLAAALNQGVRRAEEEDCSHVLLLDQDTEPQAGAVAALLKHFDALARHDPRVACVGPTLHDPATGLTHGFHVAETGLWKRRYVVGSGEPIQCANLNGSGTLMRVALFKELRGFDEALFVDHVDTEWSFRVIDRGFHIYGIPDVIFDHRMGTDSVRYWFWGWRIWPYRSPARHYYLFRNTIRLMKRRYVSATWKFWAPVKLLLTLAIHLVFDRDRRQQLRQMLRGLYHGMRV